MFTYFYAFSQSLDANCRTLYLHTHKFCTREVLYTHSHTLEKNHERKEYQYKKAETYVSGIFES